MIKSHMHYRFKVRRILPSGADISGNSLALNLSKFNGPCHHLRD